MLTKIKQAFAIIENPFQSYEVHLRSDEFCSNTQERLMSALEKTTTYYHTPCPTNLIESRWRSICDYSKQIMRLQEFGVFVLKSYQLDWEILVRYFPTQSPLQANFVV